MEDSCVDTVLALSLGFGERVASRNLWPSLTLGLSDEIYCSAAAIRKTSAAGYSSISHSPRSTSTISSLSTTNTNKEILVGSSGDDESGTRKKLRLTKEQSALLEDRFTEHTTLNPKQKQALAKQLNLRPRQVEVWFQNRRARTKLKQNEADSEFLKRCCETLAEENHRLQKELQELKSLQFIPPPWPPPPLFTQLPAANLNFCPSCERMAGTSGGAVSKVADTDGGTFMLTPKPVLPPHFFNRFAHSAAS